MAFEAFAAACDTKSARQALRRSLVRSMSGEPAGEVLSRESGSVEVDIRKISMLANSARFNQARVLTPPLARAHCDFRTKAYFSVFPIAPPQLGEPHEQGNVRTSLSKL